jgi:hypothetical protein
MALPKKALGGNTVTGKKIDRYLIFIIVLSSFIPLIGVILYFRHDDAGNLLRCAELGANYRDIFIIGKITGKSTDFFRPFSFLYVKVMYDLFSANPFWFMLASGLMMIGTVVLIYKITEELSNKTAGLFAVMAFYVSFHHILYQSFRIGVPFMHFAVMTLYYFSLLGIKRNNMWFLIFSFFLIFPAASRQSSLIIFPAIVLTYVVTNWKTCLPDIRVKIATIVVPIILAVIIIPLSKSATGTTGMLWQSGFFLVLDFFMERFRFYGNILTKNITAITIVFLTSFFIGHSITKSTDFSLRNHKAHLILLTLLSLIVAAIFTHYKSIAIIFILVTLGLSFLFDKRLGVPLIWFFTAFFIFTLIKFYHGGYLLEAGYGLSIALGMFLYYFFDEINKAYRLKDFVRTNFKVVGLSCIILLVLSGSVFYKMGRIPVISEKFQAVQVLIHTNQNFKDLINYLCDELPPNATAYEFSNEDFGLTREKWRFWSLRRRAEDLKVMDVKDMQDMVEVLGRGDIRIQGMGKILDNIADYKGEYFFTCNRFERKLAEEKLSIELLKEIRRGETEAAVYRLN